MELPRNLNFRVPMSKEEKINDAVIQGHYHVVEQLLNYGVSANTVYDGSSLLMNATECKHLEIMELLINNGADVNLCPIHEHSNGKTSIFLALGKPSLMKLLLDHGANPNQQLLDSGITSLHYLATFGRVMPSWRVSAKLLLDFGADLNIKDRNEDTPLDVIYKMESDPSRHPLFEMFMAHIENKRLENHINQSSCTPVTMPF